MKPLRLNPVLGIHNLIFTRGPLLFLAFLLLPVPARPAEVAVILSSDTRAFRRVVLGFESSLSEIKSTCSNMNNNPETGKQIIARIRSRPPAAVFTVGARASKLAADSIKDIPVIYSMVFNPSELDLRAENLTGVLMISSFRSQFESFRQIYPPLKRLGVIFNPNKTLELAAPARAAARELKLELVEFQVFHAGELSRAAQTLTPRVDALWLIPDSTVVSPHTFNFLLQTTIDSELPIFAFSPGLVKSGALGSLSPDYMEIGKEAGKLLRKVISGQTPGNLPPAYPAGKLSLNLNTARALGIAIPEKILQQADRVY